MRALTPENELIYIIGHKELFELLTQNVNDIVEDFTLYILKVSFKNKGKMKTITI